MAFKKETKILKTEKKVKKKVVKKSVKKNIKKQPKTSIKKQIKLVGQKKSSKKTAKIRTNTGIVKKKPIKEAVLGEVTHYFPRVKVAAVKLKETLKVGDIIRFKGHTTDFSQTLTSMQLEHEVIETAKRGQEIGIGVESRVRRRDKVMRV